MVVEYEKYCMERIKCYAKQNNPLRIYSFLLDNIVFLNKVEEKTKNVFVEKAKELYEECDEKINTAHSDKLRDKFLKIQIVLNLFLQKVN
jgi:hypothetical protein